MTGPLLFPPPDPPAPPDNVYPDYQAWFDQHFSVVFARPKKFIWCHEWEQHEEARIIVRYLWKTWEEATAGGRADTMVVWFRDFAYPLLDRLCEDNGTFKGCDWQGDPAPRHNPLSFPLTRG